MKNKEDKLDILWSRRIKEIHPRCVVCGYQGAFLPLDAAHIIPKARSKSIRWDLENGMSLCRMHHGQYDEQWSNERREKLIKSLFGKDRWASLLEKSRAIFKTDLDEIEANLTSPLI